MRRLKTALALSVFLLWATGSQAEEPSRDVFGAATPALSTAATSTWSAEAEAGLVATSGNTRTRSVNTGLTIRHGGGPWDNRLSARYLDASDAGQTTAERTTAAFESHYLLSERDYVFAVARYDADRFSGYKELLSETGGCGRRLLFTSDTTLEAEAGAGARQVRRSDGVNRSDAILRIAAKFRYKPGQTFEFREEAFSEYARDNTHAESATSLSSRIGDNLSMKAGFTATYNSSVPAGIERTDTITSLTLVYDFGS